MTRTIAAGLLLAALAAAPASAQVNDHRWAPDNAGFSNGLAGVPGIAPGAAGTSSTTTSDALRTAIPSLRSRLRRRAPGSTPTTDGFGCAEPAGSPSGGLPLDATTTPAAPRVRPRSAAPCRTQRRAASPTATASATAPRAFPSLGRIASRHTLPTPAGSGADASKPRRQLPRAQSNDHRWAPTTRDSATGWSSRPASPRALPGHPPRRPAAAGRPATRSRPSRSPARGSTPRTGTSR